MKVLIVSTSDIVGGAAKAAYRLHTSLLKEEINSQMLVYYKNSDDYSVISENNKFKKISNIFFSILDASIVKLYKNKSKTPFSPSITSSNFIIRKINEINPDIVHLHWICGGILGIKDLLKIKSPIIWTMHDMWAFTGGCNYDEECNLYKEKCSKCKVLNSKYNNDLSKYVFKNKLSVYSKIKKLDVIGSSKWISDCAKNSTLFSDKNIYTLGNCIDTKLFSPISKKIVRSMFNIPIDKKVILFSAMSSMNDTRKGSKELLEAINKLEVDNTIFVIAGSSRPKTDLRLKYKTYFISPLSDDVSLPLMYNIADVTIVPSLQENLANSIAECMSCGIPVVAFNIGGNSDMIEHKKNGYLVKAFNTDDMAIGIKWILNNKDYSSLSLNAREYATKKFDSSIIAKKHIDLYKKLIS